MLQFAVLEFFQAYTEETAEVHKKVSESATLMVVSESATLMVCTLHLAHPHKAMVHVTDSHPIPAILSMTRIIMATTEHWSQ